MGWKTCILKSTTKCVDLSADLFAEYVKEIKEGENKVNLFEILNNCQVNGENMQCFHNINGQTAN